MRQPGARCVFILNGSFLISLNVASSAPRSVVWEVEGILKSYFGGRVALSSRKKKKQSILIRTRMPSFQVTNLIPNIPTRLMSVHVAGVRRRLPIRPDVFLHLYGNYSMIVMTITIKTQAKCTYFGAGRGGIGSPAVGAPCRPSRSSA